MPASPSSVLTLGYGPWGSPGLVLTTGYGSATPAPVTSGGLFRRADWSWPRVFGRRHFGRVFGRANWSRVWRWRHMPTTLPAVELTKPESEDRDFGFDYSKAPELVSGLTISSAEVLGGSGLTFGTPAVTAAEFDGVAAGKVVTVRISGGEDDAVYPFAMRATLSNGRKLVIPARLVVADDYE